MYIVQSKFSGLTIDNWLVVGTFDDLDSAKAMADRIYVRTARVMMDGMEVYRNDV